MTACHMEPLRLVRREDETELDDSPVGQGLQLLEMEATEPLEPAALHKRILLAEDDPDMSNMLEEGLREDGYEVMRATDGTHLLDWIDYLRGMIVDARFADVDMIISDIRMPGASGLDALAQLRHYDRSIPVVLITAFGDEQTHERAYELGAAAVLDKPFDVDGFRAFIRELLPPGADFVGSPIA